MINKEFVESFKSTVIEAGKTFNRKPYEVTLHQFTLHSKGRCSMTTVRAVGFAALKAYLFPAPKAKMDKSTEDMIRRILNG